MSIKGEDREALKLTMRRRKNLSGIQCVAPFIGGFNVWDIPEEYWNSHVEAAIIHAYELGWRFCNEEHSRIDPPLLPINAFSEDEYHERIKERLRRDEVDFSLTQGM